VALSLARRILRSIYRAMVAYGRMYTGVHPGSADGTAPASVLELRGPGPDHPERVRPDVPLTPSERALLRGLR
jgi:hypothetical protein